MSSNADRSVPSRPATCLLLLSTLGLVPSLAVAAGTARAGRCAWELSADDASGHPVLQAPAYALDRPGLLLASLTTLGRRGVLWESLRARPDPQLEGSGATVGSFAVTEVVLADPSRDRAVLRVPGFAGCLSSPSPPDPSPDPLLDDHRATALGPGEPLVGLRERDGYRPRIFRAIFDRFIDTASGARLLLARVPDGAGAESGVLLDQRDHLVGTILPPQNGSDPSLILAVPVASDELKDAASRSGVLPNTALGQMTGQGFPQTRIGLFARALLLTRPDQADEALALMDQVAKLGGEFEGLLMERGALRYRSGRTDSAIADFAAAVRANPASHLAHYNLGVALGTAGRYREASDALGRAARLDPSHARTRYQLALALRASNRLAEAREEWEALARIDPGLAEDIRPLLSF